jgi:SAM-dependent methyltransferase
VRSGSSLVGADTPIYDDIGVTYAGTRREDPRLLRVIHDALGDAESVVNVGAGTASYEPRDRPVVAIEPSVRMIRQRPKGAAPVVRAVAESLPLASGAVEAALAVLTVHHWSNQGAGLAELCRVARERVVIFTWDPESSGFWLTRDYFPGFLRADRRRFPRIGTILGRLTDATATPVPIPHDCADGFMGAYWRRPAAYLDAGARRGISRFQLCEDVSPLEGLRRDLDSGAWEARYGEMLRADEWDLGYRLVVGRPRRQGV